MVFERGGCSIRVEFVYTSVDQTLTFEVERGPTKMSITARHKLSGSGLHMCRLTPNNKCSETRDT